MRPWECELAVTSSQALQLLRAQAVIQMTTNRCETTAKSCSGGTHGTRTYHCEFILVSYTTLANNATAGNSA